MKSGETLPTRRLPTLPILGMAAGGSGGVSDPDAQAYIERAGVTDQTAKDAINSMVIDLKAASLWTALTEAWIGRSAYNAGTGTTVHALKSAANDGTFAGTPTWSTDGLVFNANNEAVTTGLVQTMNQGWTAVAVFKDGIGDIAANRRVFGATTGPTLLFVQSADKSSSPIGAYDGSTAAVPPVVNIDVTSFKMVTTGYTSDGLASVLRVYSGGSLMNGVNHQFAAGSHTVQLNNSAASNEGMTAAVIAMGFIFGSTTLTLTEIGDLYTIIKDTICSGLSLP